MAQDEEWLTLTEALPLLGLTRGRVMQLKREGKLHLVKRLSDVGGSQLYIQRAEIARFAEERHREASSATGPGPKPRIPKLES